MSAGGDGEVCRRDAAEVGGLIGIWPFCEQYKLGRPVLELVSPFYDTVIACVDQS